MQRVLGLLTMYETRGAQLCKHSGLTGFFRRRPPCTPTTPTLSEPLFCPKNAPQNARNRSENLLPRKAEIDVHFCRPGRLSCLQINWGQEAITASLFSRSMINLVSWRPAVSGRSGLARTRKRDGSFTALIAHGVREVV